MRSNAVDSHEERKGKRKRKRREPGESEIDTVNQRTATTSFEEERSARNSQDHSQCIEYPRRGRFPSWGSRDSPDVIPRIDPASVILLFRNPAISWFSAQEP